MPKEKQELVGNAQRIKGLYEEMNKVAIAGDDTSEMVMKLNDDVMSDINEIIEYIKRDE